MALRALLAPSSVLPTFRAATKTEALTRLSEAAGRALGVPATEIFAALVERETLGSTGFGGGVAIPHGKSDGVGAVTGFFARLEAPLDWDALDGAPVDLVFMLLAPHGATAAHLKALAKVSRIFREADTKAALRGTTDTDALYAILNGPGAKIEAA